MVPIIDVITVTDIPIGGNNFAGFGDSGPHFRWSPLLTVTQQRTAHEQPNAP
jgi:hypothetical protein